MTFGADRADISPIGCLIIHMRRISVLAFVLLFSRCSDSTAPPGPPVIVTIDSHSVAIYRNTSMQLTAIVSDSQGREVPGVAVSWSSTDSTVATITASGLLTGQRTGTVYVYADAAELRDSAFVSVLLPIGKIEAIPAGITLVPGGSLQLTARLGAPSGPLDATNWAEWISRDTSVATVLSFVLPAGRVTAKAVGTSRIVAAGGSEADSAEVRVRLVAFKTVVPGWSGSTCGLATDSTAFCWGAGRTGNLGTATVDTLSYVPVGVAGGHRFATLSVGLSVACGLAAGGRAYCWGDNERGQLGIGSSFGFAREPIAVVGGHSFTTISLGAFSVCALDTDGRAWCWGNSDVVTGHATPALVGGAVRLVSLSAGAFHSCGLTTDSAAFCWGENGYGQLGDSSTTSRPVPTRVAGGLKFTSIAAGGWTTCGVTTTGAAYCWGENAYGQVGDSSHVERHVPVPVAGGHSFTGISVGIFAACGVSSGSAYCWGINISGQGGSGNLTTEYTTPHVVTGGHSFAQVRTGESHACGLTTAGLAYCWGGSGQGQLGDGSETASPVPAPSRVAGQP
jgi:alpha-tubulin suppressor-like RCC1 family protein